MSGNHSVAGATSASRYQAQFIPGGLGRQPANYRITDTLSDSRVATCFVQENADYVTAALNAHSLATDIEGFVRHGDEVSAALQLADQISEAKLTRPSESERAIVALAAEIRRLGCEKSPLTLEKMSSPKCPDCAPESCICNQEVP